MSSAFYGFCNIINILEAIFHVIICHANSSSKESCHDNINNYSIKSPFSLPLKDIYQAIQYKYITYISMEIHNFHSIHSHPTQLRCTFVDPLHLFSSPIWENASRTNFSFPPFSNIQMPFALQQQNENVRMIKQYAFILLR